MNHNEVIYDTIGVGFGPANIAVAVAMEELSFDGNVLFLEAKRNATWQANMLYEHSDIQNHPLRDLVTPRNPRSKYSFTNFLFENGRLFEHLNTGLHYPLRIEYAQYVSWVAQHFEHQTKFNTRVERIEQEQGPDGQVLYKITDQHGETYYALSVVIAPGRTPAIPEVFKTTKSKQVIHLNDFLPTIEKLDAEEVHTIAVVGGSQSAVEIILQLSQRFPKAKILGIKKCFGYKQKDVNPFTGEVYFPEFVDLFFNATETVKKSLTKDLHLTNYSASDADVLDQLYQKIYHQKILGKQKIFFHRSATINAVESEGSDIVLRITKIESAEEIQEKFSLVILATGFRNIGTAEHEERYPAILEDLINHVELDQHSCLKINYNYSISIKNQPEDTCFVNGLCESSHGMGDAGSFSLLALRSAVIVNALQQSLSLIRNPSYISHNVHE